MRASRVVLSPFPAKVRHPGPMFGPERLGGSSSLWAGHFKKTLPGGRPWPGVAARVHPDGLATE